MPPAAALPAARRAGQVRRALRLVTFSVAFGLASGASGIGGHSLAVLAVGLRVLADVTGSATLIWRFRAERSQPGLSERREQQSAVIVAAALAVVAPFSFCSRCWAWPTARGRTPLRSR